ncbi:MAG: hypothetical protein OJI67_19925 [Prosthecobacter sp.]|nr:hypothetical protein [Prosthecobacter sp.]
MASPQDAKSARARLYKLMALLLLTVGLFYWGNSQRPKAKAAPAGVERGDSSPPSY